MAAIHLGKIIFSRLDFDLIHNHLEAHREPYCSINVVNLTLCTAVSMNTAAGTSGDNDIIGLGGVHFILKRQKRALIVLIQSSHMIIIENH